MDERTKKALAEAKAEGICDIDCHGDGSINVETVELATKLMKEHGPQMYTELEKRRKSQLI